MILNLEHDVRLAASGPEALEMIKAEKPDLVFLDIRMPRMDGTEVLRRIKELTPEVEVAMITAYAAISSAQRAMRLGALDYITKPFGVAEVKAVVDRALTRRREQREQQQLMDELSDTIAKLSDQLSDARVRESRAEEGALLQGLTSVHSSLEDQLNEVLRLSSIGEVAAEVAHDLNNFLSTILFRIEIMLLDVDQRQTLDTVSLVDGLRQIALAARDGGEALERISMLAKSNPYEPNARVALNEILQEAAELSQGRVDRHEDHRVTYELEDLPVIEGSPAGLRTVFTNLIINAHHACRGAGEIVLRTFARGDRVYAQVADNGVGMTAEVLARLREPFFTTKGESGTGLGLTVSYKVVEQHQGSIEFESQPGRGTTVTACLPVTQPPREEAAQNLSAPEASEQPARANCAPAREATTILIVDDHAGMLKVTREMLESCGFQVLTTRSPAEALAMFAGAGDGVPAPDVVVTDLRMPDLPGSDLVGEVRRLRPDTVIVIVSAYLEEATDEALSQADARLPKPCDLQTLVGTIQSLLAERVGAPSGN